MNSKRWIAALGVVVLAAVMAVLAFLFSGGLDSSSEPGELSDPAHTAQVEPATTAAAERDEPVSQRDQAEADATQEEASAPSIPPADSTPNEPRGEPTMEIDFEDTSVHGIVHYIGLRSGLNIQVQGQVEVKLSVSAKSYLSDAKEAAKELLRDVCEAADLELTEHDDFIIIKSAE